MQESKFYSISKDKPEIENNYKNNNNFNFDFIIIGSGLAGLSAGIMLSKKKYRILVIEQESQVGGYAINFKRKGYRFEGSLHSLSACELGGLTYQIFNQLGIQDKLEFIKIENLKQQYDRIHKKTYENSYNIDLYLKMLTKKYPTEQENICKFIRLGCKMCKLLSKWNSLNKFSKFIYSMKSFSVIPQILKYYHRTAQDILNEFFDNEQLKHEFLDFPYFCGSMAENLSAIVFFASFLDKFQNGAYYVKGGSGYLTRVMADQIRENNGEIFLNHKVIKINIEKGYAKSIIIQSQIGSKNLTEITADHIIYCGDTRNLVNNLIDSDCFSMIYKTELNNRQIIESMFNVYLGLDIDLKKYGFKDYTNEFILPNGRKCNIIIYSNIDPSCCPENTSNVVINSYMTIDEFYRAIELDGGIRGEHYKTLKKNVTSEIVDRFCESLEIPNLKSHIVVCESATPVTYERYTSNYRGSISGYSLNFHNSVKHPVSYKTPIHNLWIAGQWTGAGGGYYLSMLNGIHSSELAIKKIKKGTLLSYI